jgi:hypothetical protein
MSRMAGDVDDEAEGSAAETVEDFAAETAASTRDGAAGGTVDPIDAYFDGIDERLEGLHGTVLKPRLDALEADRRRVRGYIARCIIVAAIPLLLYFISGLLQAPLLPYYETSPAVKFLFDYWTEVLIALEVLGLVFIGFMYVMPGLVAHLEYRRKFKQTVATEIFRALVPDGTYQPDHHLTQKAVDESGLFSGKYQRFTGDDLIRGRVGQIEYEASEVRAHGQFVSHRRRENQHTSAKPNVTEFHGLVYHFGLPGAVKGHTIVEPEDCEGRMPFHRRDFETVAFDEDAAFKEQFRVYSTDAAEARSILNPRVRKRLLTLHDHYLTSVPFLSFVRNHAFVAVHAGSNRLEPTIAKPAGRAETTGLAEYFATPALLVRELELGGSDGAATGSSFGSPVFGSSAFPAAGATSGSILSQAPAATFGKLGLDKPITSGNVLDAALDDAEDADATMTPPVNTRVTLSPMMGESVEVTYGINPAFYVRILWTLALLPFVAAGFARLAGASGEPLLAAIVERLPQVTIVSDWAAAYPLAFVPLALLFYVLPTWTMTQIPRGVRINREGIKIRKRIWPIPRTLPMDRIAGVNVSEQQVYIQRKNTAFLRRWVSGAPMMRTNEEARWVGANLRRALKMFGGLR